MFGLSSSWFYAGFTCAAQSRSAGCPHWLQQIQQPEKHSTAVKKILSSQVRKCTIHLGFAFEEQESWHAGDVVFTCHIFTLVHIHLEENHICELVLGHGLQYFQHIFIMMNQRVCFSSQIPQSWEQSSCKDRTRWHKSPPPPIYPQHLPTGH